VCLRRTGAHRGEKDKRLELREPEAARIREQQGEMNRVDSGRGKSGGVAEGVCAKVVCSPYLAGRYRTIETDEV
jgi:hypothetical protein